MCLPAFGRPPAATRELSVASGSRQLIEGNNAAQSPTRDMGSVPRGLLRIREPLCSTPPHCLHAYFLPLRSRSSGLRCPKGGAGSLLDERRGRRARPRSREGLRLSESTQSSERQHVDSRRLIARHGLQRTHSLHICIRSSESARSSEGLHVDHHHLIVRNELPSNALAHCRHAPNSSPRVAPRPQRAAL